MTPETLSQACGIPPMRAQTWAPALSAAIERFDVQAEAMFVAQWAHESDLFVHLREIWGPTPTPAQARYDQRADLGNTRPEAIAAAAAGSDRPGHWFRGAGIGQLTGYDNIRAFSLAWWGDDRAVHNPSLLAIVPSNAAATGGWYWRDRRLDVAAAPNTTEAFVIVTRKINGGTNGLENRLRLWEMAKRAGLR